MYLLGMNALSVLDVEFDGLEGRGISSISGSTTVTAAGARTPPDFGILMTVIRFPYVRCISTFSFSWPTTRITFTADSSECSSQRAVRRSTHCGKHPHMLESMFVGGLLMYLTETMRSSMGYQR